MPCKSDTVGTVASSPNQSHLERFQQVPCKRYLTANFFIFLGPCGIEFFRKYVTTVSLAVGKNGLVESQISFSLRHWASTQESLRKS